MEGFEGLLSAFDLNEIKDDDFGATVKEVEKNLEVIENKKNEISAIVKLPSVFQDEDYIRRELKTLIMSARTVMDKVEMDIKIGVDSKKIEVYSKLIDSIGKQYVSLMELNKSIFESQVKMGALDINNIGSNKISLTSDQLLDMINKASDISQMNSIDATFKIED